MASALARRTILLALTGYSAALAFILLVPWGAIPTSGASRTAELAARLGAPAWALEPARWEFACNALILMPVSMLGSLIWQRTTWKDWTAYAFVIAGTVELVQGLLLPERSATFADVVANTLGGLGGALAVEVGLTVLGRRRTPF
ncbi:VanZ family protein [Nocardioides sp.]|uniref:VanZ family protein n=1 Tax=Nocardioides sp. TaxID=35761 RepID=UPI0025E2E774|nr:VanZ family protein [Nocardioides sp.]